MTPDTTEALPTGLLPTKLFIPVLEPGLVERSRILDLLDSGEGAGLVLVSAPAGSGKTTLVSNWIHRSGTPVCWVSLDPGDDDPQVFMHGVVEPSTRWGLRCASALGPCSVRARPRIRRGW